MEKKKKSSRRSQKRSTKAYLYTLGMLLFIISILLYTTIGILHLVNYNHSDVLGKVALYFFLAGILVCTLTYIYSFVKKLFEPMNY
jgi:hypothetical protein